MKCPLVLSIIRVEILKIDWISFVYLTAWPSCARCKLLEITLILQQDSLSNLQICSPEVLITIFLLFSVAIFEVSMHA